MPARPGVTVGDAVHQTGSMYRRVLAWIRQGVPPDDWQQSPDEDNGDLIAFHTEGRDALVAELAAHPPGERCATWWPQDQTYGFWRRRMAHETAVYRMDVQAALGIPLDPVEDDFAADGVDELLLLWFGHRLAEIGMTATAHGAVGVETADRAWVGILGRSRGSARRVVAVDARAADAVISGDPMSVYRWLWGRVPDRTVEITGDIDATAQLWALLRAATR